MRKILIADPDLDAVRGLSRALRERGHQVHYAPDGSRALEVSVLRHPDLILFDAECTLLEARTFMQILKTNPRTEEIPVVLTVAGDDLDKMRGLRDGYLRKPFNLDEVLARIDHIFRRSEAAKSLKGQANEIEGTLTQLSIPDLLQILSINKRTGRLNLVRGADRGDIQVMEGRPINAHVGPVEGEKALFRVLHWSEGTFSFVPGAPGGTVRIHRAMDDALMEGMRQGDEVARILPTLPPFSTRMELSPDAHLSKDQHPVTAQVMDLLRQPRPLGDVLDLTQATDLEVLTVLGTLLDKGMARKTEAQSTGSEPLLSAAEIHSLRGRLSRSRPLAPVAIAKVFVCSSSTSALRALLAELPELKPTRAEPAPLKSNFGTLGQYSLAETLKLDFCVLPPAEPARPLWRPFCSGALGALILGTDEQAVRLAVYLAWEIRIPVVVVGAEVPKELKDAPAGALAVSEGVSASVRALLMQAIKGVETFRTA